MLHIPVFPPMRRLAVLILVCSLAIGCAWCWRHYFLAPDAGSGPVALAVPRTPFLKPWHVGPVVLLGLGDSVMEGFGSSAGKGVFQRLAACPGDEFPDMQGRSLGAVFPQLTVVNKGVSSTTSSEVVGAELFSMPSYPADTRGVVLISTGGNDLIHNYGQTPPEPEAMFGASLHQAQPWIVEYAQRLDALVARLKTLFPGGAEIFIMTIFDPTDGIGDIESAHLPAWPDGLAILAAYNQTISACAQTHAHVHIVDVHAAFIGHGIHCAQFWQKTYRRDDHGYWLYANLEDPNDRGYDAMRRLCLLAMCQVFAPVR
jgi:lysophospholipase L1-like esterase